MKTQTTKREEAMKTRSIQKTLAAAGVLVALHAGTAKAQIGMRDEIPSFAQRNLAGPRIGVTYVPEGKELSKKLKEHKMGSVLSQFGWHFEYQVSPEEGRGPSFVVELVPMIAGVEYGKLIPSASLAMGIRFPGGFEFGLGPNVLIGDGDKPVRTALVVAIGKSFNYSGVSIPLNFVCVTSPEGNRFSIIFGYAITKSVKHPVND
jgi:hypothetical protein